MKNFRKILLDNGKTKNVESLLESQLFDRSFFIHKCEKTEKLFLTDFATGFIAHETKNINPENVITDFVKKLKKHKVTKEHFTNELKKVEQSILENEIELPINLNENFDNSKNTEYDTILKNVIL